MPRTRDELEKLREGDEEIRDLGEEEEAEGFGEVPVHPNNGKGHAGEITEGVTDEGLGGIEVVVEEAEDDADEGEDEGEGEDLGGARWRRKREGGKEKRCERISIVSIVSIYSSALPPSFLPSLPFPSFSYKISHSLKTKMPTPMTRDCPASRPLMPA